MLEPLKGQIDTEKSNFTVGKVKVEVRFAKMAQGRWGALTGDAPDRMPPTIPFHCVLPIPKRLYSPCCIPRKLGAHEHNGPQTAEELGRYYH